MYVHVYVKRNQVQLIPVFTWQIAGRSSLLLISFSWPLLVALLICPVGDCRQRALQLLALVRNLDINVPLYAYTQHIHTYIQTIKES